MMAQNKVSFTQDALLNGTSIGYDKNNDLQRLGLPISSFYDIDSGNYIVEFH
jgi:hypothetical protein